MDQNNQTKAASLQDVPALKALWGTVFGDGPEELDRFFDSYFDPALTVIIGEAGAISAAAYILPIGRLYGKDGSALPCAMLYAIATDPSSRGRGYGEAVTRAAAARAREAGYSAVVLCPASDSLFDFYAGRCGFQEYFSVWESRIKKDGLPKSTHAVSLETVTPEEYGRLRRAALADAAYIDVDGRGLRYQAALCADTGGGLYAVMSGGTVCGCAIVERPSNDEIAVKELLLTDGCGVSDALTAVFALFPEETCFVRARSGGDMQNRGIFRRFGMLMPGNGLPGSGEAGTVNWYGPAFD